ncbi:MAG: glycosyltransferase [Cytophagales bacterium]|nr:glycosyltransferase [Bernardetiaceae bacterium]MDW8210104.1 glycosyltransferase [Cytophagales bacterium]
MKRQVNRKSVVIASLLKPVDDVRNFERFALSLNKDFEIFIIGAPTMAALPRIAGIHFLAYPFFPRRLGQRLKACFTFMKKLWQIKPDAIIVQSPDLLLFAICYKFFYSASLIYDVCENYRLNILHQGYYRGVKKYLLAFGVQVVELISSPFVRRYWLAEQSYADELSFARKKFDFVFNKFIPLKPIQPRQRILSVEKMHLIYTGTVSRSYGAHLAIELTKKLHQFMPTVSLLVIGSCTDENYLQELEKMLDNCHFITWCVFKQPVNHQRIISAMAVADVAIMPYLPNRSTQRCIPTKIYECLALQLPMLLPYNPLWEGLTQPYKAALHIDFEGTSPEELLQKILTTKFYTLAPPEEVWKFSRTQFRQMAQKWLT